MAFEIRAALSWRLAGRRPSFAMHPSSARESRLTGHPTIHEAAVPGRPRRLWLYIELQTQEALACAISGNVRKSQGLEAIVNVGIADHRLDKRGSLERDVAGNLRCQGELRIIIPDSK